MRTDLMIAPRTVKGSKNNPFLCPHCPYKTTRRYSMRQHLRKVHRDWFTEPMIQIPGFGR